MFCNEKASCNGGQGKGSKMKKGTQNLNMLSILHKIPSFTGAHISGLKMLLYESALFIHPFLDNF